MNDEFARLAESFMCALLARDPLASQRFTEISRRLSQLSQLAHQCAAEFLSARERWLSDPEQAKAEATRAWDFHAMKNDEPRTPKSLL